MGRTIIQPIGPLYGEAVNGTVFGRPNGSIYVPPSNNISVKFPDNMFYVIYRSGRNYFCNSEGNTAVYDADGARLYPVAIANSQDTASYMFIELSETDEFTTSEGRSLGAGVFNFSISRVNTTGIEVTDGTTYYFRAVLMSSTGVAVATSETYEVTGVVPE